MLNLQLLQNYLHQTWSFVERVAQTSEQNNLTLCLAQKQLKSEFDGFMTNGFPQFVERLQAMFHEVIEKRNLQTAQLREYFEDINKRLSNCDQFLIHLQTWANEVNTNLAHIVEVEVAKALSQKKFTDFQIPEEVSKKLDYLNVGFVGQQNSSAQQIAQVTDLQHKVSLLEKQISQDRSSCVFFKDQI